MTRRLLTRAEHRRASTLLNRRRAAFRRLEAHTYAGVNTPAGELAARRLLAAAEDFFNYLNDNNIVYPDDWHRWDIARWDAQNAIARTSNPLT